VHWVIVGELTYMKRDSNIPTPSRAKRLAPASELGRCTQPPDIYNMPQTVIVRN
jgi:hypothetical protein